MPWCEREGQRQFCGVSSLLPSLRWAPGLQDLHCRRLYIAEPTCWPTVQPSHKPHIPYEIVPASRQLPYSFKCWLPLPALRNQQLKRARGTEPVCLSLRSFPAFCAQFLVSDLWVPHFTSGCSAASFPARGPRWLQRC